MKAPVWLFALLSPLATTGCKTYSILTPIQPAPRIVEPFVTPTKVDSVKPTFTWMPSSDPNATYDFVIWEAVKMRPRLTARAHEYYVGKEGYYREGLKQSSHTLELPLQHYTEYFWSVRLRKDSRVSAWSTYDWYNWSAFGWNYLGYYRARNLCFLFRTP